MNAPSPFHAGEQSVQSRVGVREQSERLGRRMIRDHMPEQHRELYEKLPFVVVGHLDDDGWPWASILAGAPGFVGTPDARSMRIQTRPVVGDPLSASLRQGLKVGLLGLELATRRRNRLNLEITAVEDDAINLSVDQSFGNCPQYIQTRALRFLDDRPAPTVEHLTSLDDDGKALVSGSDTFFVASSTGPGGSGPTMGADASHRGGRPGFVQVSEDGVLTVPDFSGNNAFNTLGNFEIYPRAGLLFIDFDTGDLLSLTGAVQMIWDGPEVQAFQGADRLWRFTPHHGVRIRGALPFTFSFGQSSPYNELTGTWSQAEDRRRAEALRSTWRSFRVVRAVDESSVIRSFFLEPADKLDASPFAAGQHITLEVPVGADGPILRNYTVSSAPADGLYRISVKREGVASSWLHDRVQPGQTLRLKGPAGGMTLDASVKRPVVLLSAGVGVTPMMSMLRHVISEGQRTRHFRRTFFIHSARNSTERAFFEEARSLATRSQGAVQVYSFLTAPEDTDTPGITHNGEGRITAEAISAMLPLDDYDFYLCGPEGFMQAMYDALLGLGVRDGRIFSESFGPSSLVRRPEEVVAMPASETPVAEAVVSFTRAGFEMPWLPDDGTLLELAEAHGLKPEFSCRSGSCGSCTVKLLKGRVTYPDGYTATLSEDEALMCCGVPATEEVALDL
ncbi:MAG: pyridoxamine 5'-phosphate oxidase family protein [Bradymonadia bacterium]